MCEQGSTHAVTNETGLQVYKQEQQLGDSKMDPIDLDRALRKLRLGGIAAVLESRLRQAETESMAPIDLISRLVSDEVHHVAGRALQRWILKERQERKGPAGMPTLE
jgi:hypothetical protein